MITPTVRRDCVQFYVLLVVCITTLVTGACFAQETADKASLRASLGNDGAGTFVVEAHGLPPAPPPLFTASASAKATVSKEQIDQSITVTVKVIQGTTETVKLGLKGTAVVVDIQGDGIASWAVQQSGDDRFIEIVYNDKITQATATIQLRSQAPALPGQAKLSHLLPGDAVGFTSSLDVLFEPGVVGKTASADGFYPLLSSGTANQFHTSTGGTLTLSLAASGTAPAPISIGNMELTGQLDASGDSIAFQYTGTANVSKPGSELRILAGNAALDKLPQDPGVRLILESTNEGAVYELRFAEVGQYEIDLTFVAAVSESDDGWLGIDFTLPTSAVVPMSLEGLPESLEFQHAAELVVPVYEDDLWQGFLPANGRSKVAWKQARKTGTGKLFFTTQALVEAQVSSGLLKQSHQIAYQVLQGKLESVTMELHGPGEVLDVEGRNIVGWKVVAEGDQRTLDVTLSQPIEGTGQLRIRTQTALAALPVRVEGLVVKPIGALRHSGFVRLSNAGAVNLEPTDLQGLTQLSPNQYPGEAIQSRQVFVYRFPAADHEFFIAADRIQPEVNIAHVLVYKVTESDRSISADIELDIREAPIREWDIELPADYSIVSVTGTNVGDYIAATEVTGQRRNLKVVFSSDVAGRQLISLQLEKNVSAADAQWDLPSISHPNANSTSGNIGVAGAPGYRIAMGQSTRLVEKPLSYFPKPVPSLQQAFRIRESDWTASVAIETLERSVQSDVFHLYSLSNRTAYGSSLINYFVTGAPVAEFQITVPDTLENVLVDGQDVRTWRREGDTLFVSLHQSVMGPYTLLVTYEQTPSETTGLFDAGQVTPLGVQGERGYIQVVSPMQVEISTLAIAEDVLVLDPLELPAEFRLLSTAPALGTWQYTQRPFNLNLKVDWFQPGSTVAQVVEFSEVNTRVSADGEHVTDILYYLKTRGQGTLKIRLPADPSRLWEAAVNGQPITARKAGEDTLIPLPGGTDPNIPVELRLRIGKPATDALSPKLSLPTVYAPILKTDWNIASDDHFVLEQIRGSFANASPVAPPSGFDWITKRGLPALAVICLLALLGSWASNGVGLKGLIGVVGLACSVAVGVVAASVAFDESVSREPLRLSLPALAASEVVELDVRNVPLWQAALSVPGIVIGLVGVALLIGSFLTKQSRNKSTLRFVAFVGISAGLLVHANTAGWFFALIALALFVLLFVPKTVSRLRGCVHWIGKQLQARRQRKAKTPKSTSDVVATSVGLLLAIGSLGASPGYAQLPDGFSAADSVQQEWVLTQADSRLVAQGSIQVTGKPGDHFFLLRTPAVLTSFESEQLRIDSRQVPGVGMAYVVTIPAAEEAEVDADQNTTEDKAPSKDRASPKSYRATFAYQMENARANSQIAIPTGMATINKLSLTYDELGWEVTSSSAIRIESKPDDSSTSAALLFGPQPGGVTLRPIARDVSSEETKFFVEGTNLYLPGPGVVDGRHQIQVRPSQGQIRDLSITVPAGLTVSTVDGPIGSWQFDAEQGLLTLAVQPPQSKSFSVNVQTQRGLATLPAELTLAPLSVLEAESDVGLLAIAFGQDAQPEKSEPVGMSAVNASDFDPSLLPTKDSTLHRVYRYADPAGELLLRVAPVQPEVRIASKQVLSFGDERVVLGINFAAEIKRAGLFQLTFPLPEGLEVESLSGDALHHWAELTTDNGRQIVMHLSGKTIGAHQFTVALAGTTPTDTAQWQVPSFRINEAVRQTGELVVRPTAGIRLRPISRQNVSETDPREVGGNGQGALAFRLLQDDWLLVLGVEQLDPWVTGQVLQEMTLREGQTRSQVIAHLNIQNASIRTLQISIPISDEDSIKTLRATGEIVSDFVRVSPDSNIWELQLKRRAIGKMQFKIEFERRGDRIGDAEQISPIGIPDARQLAYYFAIRAGGRLELETGSLSQGWQKSDWNSVPPALRKAADQSLPALTLRAAAPPNALRIRATRHSLADSLKLRIASGTITTVLSHTGDQLTEVDVQMEVIQRSSLSVQLPDGGELFSIFVNGESVHSIRTEAAQNTWQFYILPGLDDSTATVRIAYSVPGDRLDQLDITSPLFNVPLENIQWDIITPEGVELTRDDGNLELIGLTTHDDYDRESYLSKVRGKRESQKEQAKQLLDQAGRLLQSGQQSKARWAFNSVANQYALDAASNEDARVKLENLQTTQAIVGLNTRRQRILLDNEQVAGSSANGQLLQAAAGNRILQQDQLNFRPQELSQLLGGNSKQDNAVLQQIAGRLVQHQRATEPAPQAIIISLPEEGNVYSFSRSVQVAENSPLELELSFAPEHRLKPWQVGLAVALLALLAATVALSTKGSQAAAS